MTSVEIEIEPPGLPDDEDDDGPGEIMIGCIISEPDDTRRAGYASVTPDADEEEFARAVVDAMRGVAAARGPGLAAALDRLLTPEGRHG